MSVSCCQHQLNNTVTPTAHSCKYAEKCAANEVISSETGSYLRWSDCLHVCIGLQGFDSFTDSTADTWRQRCIRCSRIHQLCADQRENCCRSISRCL